MWPARFLAEEVAWPGAARAVWAASGAGQLFVRRENLTRLGPRAQTAARLIRDRPGLQASSLEGD